MLTSKYCAVWTMPTFGSAEVGHGLVEELRAHREIGVDDGDELSGADGEGMGEVASLLHLTRVRAHDVREAVPACEVAHLLPGGIVEHVDGLGAAPGHPAHVLEGVVQHGQRLAAAGQEHVHRLALLPVARHGGLMLGQGQPRPPDSQPEVDHDRRHHDHEQQPHERRDKPRRARPRGHSRREPRRRRRPATRTPSGVACRSTRTFPGRQGAVAGRFPAAAQRPRTQRWSRSPPDHRPGAAARDAQMVNRPVRPARSSRRPGACPR